MKQHMLENALLLFNKLPKLYSGAKMFLTGEKHVMYMYIYNAHVEKKILSPVQSKKPPHTHTQTHTTC